MRNLISSGLRRFVRQESRYAQGDRHARVIAVATVKGGVGKTTTSVHVACGLARKGRKVLLVDLDAQGHCESSLKATTRRPTERTPLSEALLSDDGIELLDVVCPSGIPNLDFTPADRGLGEAEGRISQKIGKELLLRDAMKVTRSHYDYIILDCPPNKGNLTLNALLSADSVLIPTDVSPLSVQGADELLGTVMTVNERLHHNLDILGIVFTRVDARNTQVNDSIFGQVEDAWGDLIFETRIGVNTKLAQAQLEGKPIYDFDPRSRGASHYEALTEEIYLRLENRSHA